MGKIVDAKPLVDLESFAAYEQSISGFSQITAPTLVSG